MSKRGGRLAATRKSGSPGPTDAADRSAAPLDSWWWGPWLTAGVAVLVYLNSMPGNFVFDDKHIVGRPDLPPPARLKDPSGWSQIWTSHYWAAEGERPWERKDLLYRPLTLQTFALNYLISRSPWHFHLVNVVLYGLVCLGVWHLANRIFASPLAATAGGLLFAVHPLHTEVVANLVGRSELLAGGFITAALLSWRRDGQQPALRWAALGLLCAAGAMLSKESGLTLLPLAILLDWWWSRRRPRAGQPEKTADRPAPHRGRRFWTGRLKRCYLPLMVIIIAYMTARYYACNRRFRQPPKGEMDNPLAAAEPIGRILGPFKILGKYTALFVFPRTLSADYSYNSFPPPTSPAEPLVLLGIGTVVVGLAGAIISWRRKREWLLLLGMFLFPYALVSNSVILIGTILGERLFFWPSMPLCLLLGRFAESVWRRARNGPAAARQVRLAGIGVLAVLAGRTMWRNVDWSDDLLLTQASRVVQPHSAKVRMGYAGVLLKKANRQFEAGRFEASYRTIGHAKEEFEAAVDIFPEYSQAWLGVAEAGGRFLLDQGARLIQYKVLQQKGTRVTAAIAQDILQAGREWVKGLNPLERASIEEAAEVMAAYRQMFGPLDGLAEGRYHDLRSVLDDGQLLTFRIYQAGLPLLGAKPARRRPADIRNLLAGQHDPDVILRYALVMLESGKFREALPFLSRAHELFPQREDVAIGLAKALFKGAGDPVGATEVLVGVLERNYDSWQGHMYLGLLHQSVNPDSAVQHGRKAVELAPRNLVARGAYARILAGTGHYAEAIEQYETILEQAPDLPLRTRLIKWRIKKLQRKVR